MLNYIVHTLSAKEGQESSFPLKRGKESLKWALMNVWHFSI